MPVDTLKVKPSPSTPTSPSRRAFAYIAKFLSLPRKKFSSISSSNGTSNSKDDISSITSKTPSPFGSKADRSQSQYDRFIGKLQSAGGILGSSSGSNSNKLGNGNLPNYPIYVSACLYGTVPADCANHISSVQKSGNMTEQYFPSNRSPKRTHKSQGAEESLKNEHTTQLQKCHSTPSSKELADRNRLNSNTPLLVRPSTTPEKCDEKDKENNSPPRPNSAASASSLSINFNPEIYPEKYSSRFLKIPPDELNMMEAVKLPTFVEEYEWIATNMLSLFKNVFTIYDTISIFCQPKNAKCREMKGVNDEKFYRDLFKNTQDLTHAPRYIQWVYERCTEIIANQDFFPTKYGEEFGEDFMHNMTVMARWLYNIISHLYYAHFVHLVQFDNMHLYLNQTLAHLVLFTDEFNILSAKERSSLWDLIKFIVPKGSLKETRLAPLKDKEASGNSKKDKKEREKEKSQISDPSNPNISNQNLTLNLNSSASNKFNSNKSSNSVSPNSKNSTSLIEGEISCEGILQL